MKGLFVFICFLFTCFGSVYSQCDVFRPAKSHYVLLFTSRLIHYMDEFVGFEKEVSLEKYTLILTRVNNQERKLVVRVNEEDDYLDDRMEIFFKDEDISRICVYPDKSFLSNRTKERREESCYSFVMRISSKLLNPLLFNITLPNNWRSVEMFIFHATSLDFFGKPLMLCSSPLNFQEIDKNKNFSRLSYFSSFFFEKVRRGLLLKRNKKIALHSFEISSSLPYSMWPFDRFNYLSVEDEEGNLFVMKREGDSLFLLFLPEEVSPNLIRERTHKLQSILEEISEEVEELNLRSIYKFSDTNIGMLYKFVVNNGKLITADTSDEKFLHNGRLLYTFIREDSSSIKVSIPCISYPHMDGAENSWRESLLERSIADIKYIKENRTGPISRWIIYIDDIPVFYEPYARNFYIGPFYAIGKDISELRSHLTKSIDDITRIMQEKGLIE